MNENLGCLEMPFTIKAVLKRISLRFIIDFSTKIIFTLKYGRTKYECPICQNKVRKFIPLHKRFMITLYIQGSKYTANDSETMNVENYSCPFCGASDRERLYHLYINQRINRWKIENRRVNLVHFAPEKALSDTIRNISEIKYRTADLFMNEVDDKVDLTNMYNYNNESFDFFICSHVLEHIPNDIDVMKELHRILKKDGSGILVVPIMLGLRRTFEDFTKTSPEERLEYFGQEDHVRVYSKTDFIEKVQNAGFRIEQLGREYFGDEVFQKYGITERSILYIVRKI